MKKIFLLLAIATIVFSTNSMHNENLKNKKNALMDSIQYAKKMPEWAKNCNIYEVNTRQYTPEGTFSAFQKHLPRLKEMGVDILWLMPINKIGLANRKGKLGSYYAIMNYKELNPEYGTIEDLKRLITEAHKLGMHVIVDWVANHTSWDNVWMKLHSDWYTKDSLGNVIMPAGTDWSDTADLNYSNHELRQTMIDAMLFWIKEADIDGFRCDVAGMVPINFWIHARKAIDAVKPDCFFLAEAGEPAIHQAFDMSYDWPLKDVMNGIAKGKKTAKDIARTLTDDQKNFKVEDLRMQFITNHDENTWSGTEYERLGKEAVDAFNVLIYTIPGMPLTYTGQEEPMYKRLRFFDKDTVGFVKYERKTLLTKLNKLKKENKALWNITYGGTMTVLQNSAPETVLCILRQKDGNKVLSIFNFSAKEQNFKISDEISGMFTNYLGEQISIARNAGYKLKPWGYSVMISK